MTVYPRQCDPIQVASPLHSRLPHGRGRVQATSYTEQFPVVVGLPIQYKGVTGGFMPSQHLRLSSRQERLFLTINHLLRTATGCQRPNLLQASIGSEVHRETMPYSYMSAKESFYYVTSHRHGWTYKPWLTSRYRHGALCGSQSGQYCEGSNPHGSASESSTILNFHDFPDTFGICCEI